MATQAQRDRVIAALGWTFYDESERGWYIFHVPPGAAAVCTTSIKKILAAYGAKTFEVFAGTTNGSGPAGSLTVQVK